MHLVPKNPDGQIKWNESFEVSSLEDFVWEKTERIRQSGVEHHRLSIVSPRQIDYRDVGGKLIESYHARHPKECRLI